MKRKYLNPNWKKLIEDIEGAVPSWSTAKLLHELNMPSYTFYKLKLSEEGNTIYATGASIVHLHERLTKKGRN